MRSLLMVTLLLFVVCPRLAAAPPEQRAVWGHFRDIQDPEAVERTIRSMVSARLNTIYILVWYNGGQAAYQSELSPMQQGTAAGFDPLGALIQAAHPQGIAVHAWFVNGSYGSSLPGHVFGKHPDWQLQSEDSSPNWFDLGKPEVRAFERDVMLECLKNYDVDGIHFDYIRFNSHGMCYCRDCQREVQQRYGIPAVSAARGSFPLACQMSGNPLDKPTTAQVLAVFDDGVPAVTLNRLGEGEVALFNWQAGSTGNPAVSRVARQLLARFEATRGTVYQLRNSETTARYGLDSQTRGIARLRSLGCSVISVSNEQMEQIPDKATVVLQGQYLISARTAAWLEQFVAAGGHALFIDGPVFAIKEPALQRVLGLTATARYFNKLRVINPASGQDLIPSGLPVDLELEVRRARAWEQYWRASVTDLVGQVYRGAKALKPQAWVTAAVFYNRQAADGVCQDWYGWLDEGIIDYVLPMAYTEDNAQLTAALDEWTAFDSTLQRIIPGLSIYSKRAGRSVPRDITLVLQQQELCRSRGAHGNSFFSLHFLTPDLAEALATGPYTEIVKPYFPPPRVEDSKSGAGKQE